MYLFFGLRAAQGVLSGGSRYGNTALLCAFIADVHPADTAARTKDFGVVFAASMVGSALSPLINLLPTDGKDRVGANDRVIFACAACAAGLNVLYCLYLLPETRRGAPLAAHGRGGRESKRAGAGADGRGAGATGATGAGEARAAGEADDEAGDADAGRLSRRRPCARGALAMLWSPFDAVLFLFRPSPAPVAAAGGGGEGTGTGSGRGRGSGERDGDVDPRFDTRRRVLICLAVVSFFGSLPESGILDVSLYYLKDKLGFDRKLNGWLFFGFGIVGLLAQTIVLRVAMRLLRRQDHRGKGEGKGEGEDDGDVGKDDAHAQVGGLKWLLVLALIAESAHFAVYALSTRVWMPFLAIGLAAIYLLSTPAMNGIVSATLSSDEQGAGLGALGSVKSLCGVFGPFLFTGLYARGKHISPPLPELPFIVSSALVFVAVAAAVALPNYRPASRDGGKDAV